MFSFLFGGKLGELVAPRTVSNKELWSLIKAGLTDKALTELRNTRNVFDVNELDPVSGMSLLHLTCAQGAMELVVELLSMGADIATFSKDGNNCLHFAAINDRKGIVEILLRSGADPSIPNQGGILSVELSRHAAVKELFLRDRSTIFSPIVQTRMLLSDYIEQMNLGNSPQNTADARAPAQSTIAAVANSSSDQTSSKSAVFNMADALDTPETSPPPHALAPAPTTPLVVHQATAPMQLIRQFSALDSPAGTHSGQPQPQQREDPSDYTLVGVASVKKSKNPANPNRVVEDYDSSENAAELRTRLHATAASPPCRRSATDEPPPPPPMSTPGGSKAAVPKLNLGGLATLSPPPTDAECALQQLQAMTLSGGGGGSGITGMHSARSGPLNSTASTSSASRSNSISFYQAPPMPVPAVIGAMTTPRTERSDNNNIRMGALASFSQDATPSRGPSLGGHGMDESEQQHQDQAELRQAVLQAAAQTAMAMQSNRDDFEARRLMVRNCQKLNEVHLRKLLTFDPRLAMARTTEMGNLAVDGQTPLHVAAGFGNTEALRIMVEKGEGVSLWVRDLQGRTPLHVAAQKDQQGTCEYLREAMRAERQQDPIGEHAPTDLAGTTPLGWATIGAKGKPKKADMIKALFSPGDRSILPRTPVSTRAGKSPWKAPPSAGYDKLVRENVVFAFSEANGWTPNMEDRIIVSCPVTGRPAWSLFGVCDGHGGAFCSEFLSVRIPAMLAKEAAMLARYMGGGEAEVTQQQLEELLRRVCIDADAELAAHPRMLVDHVGTGRVKYSCMDSSGSTAILALVTAQYVAVANVGDSRAVLGVRPSGQVSANALLSSPFPKSPRSSFAGPGSDSAELSREAETPTGGHLLEAVGLSRDHKVAIPEEKARIEAAGASIEQVGETVEGRESVFQISTPACDVKLRMTRSFGDFYLKQNKDLAYEQQAVVAVPEVVVHIRSARDAFVVLACDGIWDVMTNQDVVDFMADKLGYTAYGGPVGGVTTQSAAAACDALLQACLERGTVDNISVVLVALGPPSVPPAAAIVSARGTPIDALNSEAPINVTPTNRASSAQFRHSAQYHTNRNKSTPDDSDVDIPIFDLHRPNTGSLNQVFAAVAEEEDMSPLYAASPLNTVSSSNRVKKNLSFNEL